VRLVRLLPVLKIAIKLEKDLAKFFTIIVFLVIMICGCFFINEISNVYISQEIIKNEFFSSLIKDNWEGITSISDDKKKTLLDNLSSQLAGNGINEMKNILFVVFSLFVVMSWILFNKIAFNKN
jgi:hypothetical protein